MSGVRERPILMSAPMVRAIIAGAKVQTRRVINDSDYRWWAATSWEKDDDGWPMVSDPYGDWYRLPCPYGEPGDHLWVRETWAPGRDVYPHADWLYREEYSSRFDEEGLREEYAKACYGETFRWRPSIFMPRRASRLTLEVTEVRVERVQAISVGDVRAEGVDCPEHDFASGFCTSPCGALFGEWERLWDGINAKRGHGWDTNPWVWAISFRRVTS
jgi:hypothetical protein